MAATGVGLVTLFAAAPAAQAADVRTGSPYYGGPEVHFLSYFADNGEVNTPTFDAIEGGVRVTDPTAELRSSNDSCEISDDGHTATCLDEDDFTSMSIVLGDLDDTAVNNVPGPPESEDEEYYFTFDFHMVGGSGDDDLTGSDSADDRLSGDQGTDVMNGRGGEDYLEDGFYYGYPSDDAPGSEPNELSGGEDDDYIYGGPGTDELNGDGGDDLISDNHGGAVMSGGPGDDRFNRTAYQGDKTPGTATIDGGAGSDLVSYYLYSQDSPFYGGIPDPTDAGAIVKLDAAAPTTGNGTPDQNDSLANVEDAVGTAAADTMTGSALPNNLVGFDGNDTIDGGGGRDNLEGGRHGDTMRAQDGEPDRVRCGETSGGETGDSAAVDEADIVERCPAEGAGTTINRPAPPQQPQPQVVRVPVPGPPGPPAPPRDLTAPNITGTKLGKTIKRKSLLKPGYRVQVASNDAQPNQVVATMTGRLKGRARISAIGDLIVAQRTRSFTGRTSFRLKPSGKLRKAIRRGSRLRVLVEVRDAAGNVSRRSVRLRVR
jgi:Ca2+-binding RTX toxin-like protein